jgi:MoaD family protein
MPAPSARTGASDAERAARPLGIEDAAGEGTVEAAAGHSVRSAGSGTLRSRSPILLDPSVVAMTQAASITIHVPTVLRTYCDGDTELELSAADVRHALTELEHRFPALHRNICDETGAVRRHVNVFVNSSNMRDREGLDTPLAPGDVLTILPAVSGG